MDGFTAVNSGARIMRRYNDPTKWVDGATLHETLRGKMAIRIREAEVRPDNAATLVVANIAAIHAWARDVELLPQGHVPDVMHMSNDTSYLVVPKQHWDRARQALAAL
jgi:hypothetical protein